MPQLVTAPASDTAHVPTVYDRLLEVQNQIALLLLLARALANAGDLMMEPEETEAAWFCVAHMLDDASDHLRAVQAALDGKANVRAPSEQEDRDDT